MPEAVYRTMTLLCALVVACPIGTNLGLLHLLWMLASGQLLGSRGAVIPGLRGAACPAGRCGGPGRRWGRAAGAAGRCWRAGRPWWRARAPGRHIPTAASTPSRST